jgi:1,4-dihydroxy-2-naphthoate polyprenyltransferase
VSIVAILLLSGTMLLATYSGFRRHLDRSQVLGASRLLREGLLPAQNIRWAGLLCLIVGIVLGLFLVGVRGMPLLAIGLLSVIGGLLYAGWPVYFAPREFEEGTVCICLGPLAVLGAYTALTGVADAQPLLVSLPIGLLAASILYASHLVSFPEDVQAKHQTLAVRGGWDKARLLFVFLVSVPYLLVWILILTATLPGWAWLTFLSLPLACRGVWAVWRRAAAQQTQHLAGLELQMGHAYLAFGVLLGLGLILG